MPSGSTHTGTSTPLFSFVCSLLLSRSHPPSSLSLSSFYSCKPFVPVSDSEHHIRGVFVHCIKGSPVPSVHLLLPLAPPAWLSLLDLHSIYCHLYHMDVLSHLREHQLSPDSIATCWYILLSGSVFVKEHMYLARCCWIETEATHARNGKKEAGTISPVIAKILTSLTESFTY
ncbi:hypothetical protein PAMP_007292 [Pampus punctatissimus]